MKEMLINILDALGLAYWVEITTDNPRCVYYFGPFLNKQDSQLATDGYLEDLRGENAQNITYRIKRFKPDYHNLTVFEDSGNNSDFQPTITKQFSSINS